MTPALKSCIFALFVSAINWHYFKSTVTQLDQGHLTGNMTTTIDLTGAGLVTVFCVIALFFLGRSLYRRVRRLLAAGIVVPKAMRWFDGAPCVLLAPLFLRLSSSWSTSASQGESVTVKWGYGTESPWSVLLLCIGLMAVYQIHKNLAPFDPNPSGK